MNADRLDDIENLVDRADLDALVRLVDGLCTSRDWDLVLRTRDLCKSATKTGRQVWPIATLCEYRLALHAPGEWACRVVDEGASRFSIGPLTEVIAQNHSWAELRDRLEPGPHRDLVAHERVIRGDSIDSSDPTAAILDLPFHLCEWEPPYTIAQYSDDGITAPCPADTWTHDWTDVAARDEPITDIDDDETESALRSLVEPWTASSGGRARCIGVEGGLASLAAAMDTTSLRVARISSHQALDWLGWCGASAGAHGRRRGSAAGRFNSWWMIAALGGIDWDDASSHGTLHADLGRVADRLDWYRVGTPARHSYELSLAAVNLDENITFGLFAYDDPM